MSPERASAEPGPLVCLGEALVDLICPDSVDDPAEATRFEVHFGGALSNVAVAARRAGAEVAIAGGAGDDPWGTFLRRRFEAEGIDLTFQATLEDVPTAFAFATLDAEREPSFDIHGAGIDAAIASLAGREQELVEFAAAICFGSNTTVQEDSLAVTRAVRAAALAAGVPLLFDPNLRPARWDDIERARILCRELAEGCALLKCNLREARWLTGSASASPTEAAEELLGLGPDLAVVTAGAEALVARGLCSAERTPPSVEMLSPLGSGDVFMGTLAAGLLRDGWEEGERRPCPRARRRGRRRGLHPTGRLRLMSGGGERGYARRKQGAAAAAGELDRRPRFPVPKGWKRPARTRVRAIRDRLREIYGSRRNDPHDDPVHELVLTILSQNTSDGNRDVAYRRLRDRFDDWAEVRDAPTAEVIEAIRPGGLANTKGPRIQAVLGELGPEAELDWIREAPRAEVIGYLTSLPGVGRKTAACVMIFALDRPEIPVDTHVYRVGGRLGLFPPKISLEAAHDEMLAVTDPADAYELHLNLIAHGRRICRPRPRCGECDLARMCPARRDGLVDPVT